MTRLVDRNVVKRTRNVHGARWSAASGSGSTANAAGAALRAGLGLATGLCTLLGVLVGTVGPAPVATSGTAASGTGVLAAAPASVACDGAWVGAWQSAGQSVPGAGLAGTTVRLLVRPQVTGSAVRIRLSNVDGTGRLGVGAASIVWSGGAAAAAAAPTPLSFATATATVTAPEIAPHTVPGTGPGASGTAVTGSIELGVGAVMVSDPVPLVVEAGRPLAVSLYLDAVPDRITAHPVALQTSYRSGPGDHTLERGSAPFDGPDAQPVTSWPVLAGVEVLAPRPEQAVVAVGDSITDGVGSVVDGNGRWTDAMAERLATAGGPSRMAVLNAGIAGNRLLGADPAAAGAAPLDRLGRDLAAPGVTDVVLHVGTNDLAAGASPGAVIAGLQDYADAVSASGRRVFLTTITPAGSGAHGRPDVRRARDEVNTWILGHGREHASGVFDFAAAVADSADPARLSPAFDSGDGLHLSAEGHRALAAAIDPAALSGSPCLRDTTPARIRAAADPADAVTPTR